MKTKRQDVILDIISTEEIETQFQLQDALAARGIVTTQATLSRDVKDLNLSKKINGNNKYVYVQETVQQDEEESLGRLLKIFKECVVSSDIAQNIAVIKTLPGLAGAACSAFDSMEVKNLAGTIAGDDTAFLLFKDNTSAEEFINEISTLIRV